jgi:hypothetical protein
MGQTTFNEVSKTQSIDTFLNRIPKQGYNCHDFVREVWMYLKGEDIAEKLKKLVGAFSNRKVTVSGLKGFTKLDRPESPCFVVMQRFKFVPHIGIYLDGRILHLGNRGAAFEFPQIAQGYFKRLSYYK